MAVVEEEREPWQEELANVGFARRLLQARRWYKADWWFVAISSVLVVLFFVVALFPQWFAPYDPREEVGARVLAPGESPAVEVLLVAKDSPVTSLADLATGEREAFGIRVGDPTSDVARDEAERLTEISQESGGERIQLRLTRFNEFEEMFVALEAGELVTVGAPSDQNDDVMAAHPGVIIAGAIAEADVGPGQSFVLGTNRGGQDMLNYIIWGTRVAFLIGFASALLVLVVGVPLGLSVGFTSGRYDRLLTLVMDSLYAFPGLILAIAIAAVLGPSIGNVIVAISVLYVPTYFRIVRGQTLTAKEELYVEAARSLGAKSLTILRRYVAPNVIPSVAIIFSVNVADAILTGAGLSFLGLGLPPDTPDWGIDLAKGQQSIQTAWWLVTFPGVAVMLVVLSFTMMGEGLVEIFNPKLRDR